MWSKEQLENESILPEQKEQKQEKTEDFKQISDQQFEKENPPIPKSQQKYQKESDQGLLPENKEDKHLQQPKI